MSLLNVMPDSVTAAAGNLQDIGAAVKNANAAAATQTTAIAAPAADEVSAAITALFGAQAQEFQALSAEASAFHGEFVNLLTGGAMQYLNTEIANAEQMLVKAVNAPAQLLLGHPLIGTGQSPAAGVAAASGFWQNLWQNIQQDASSLYGTASNWAGKLAGSQMGEELYNAATTLTSKITGLPARDVIGVLIAGAVGSLIGPEGTIGGAELALELEAELGTLEGVGTVGTWNGLLASFEDVAGQSAFEMEQVWEGIAGGSLQVPTLAELAGEYGPGFVAGELFNYFTDADKLIASAFSSFPSNVSYIYNSLIANPFSNFLAQLQTPPSGWNGLGPSIAITSDVVGPWGADGIQQDVTGVFTFGAGPFAAQVGSFSGMSAADMNGGMASVSATVFGIRESGSVYSSDGGAPQFSFSVDAPGVTGLLQDLATYLP